MTLRIRAALISLSLCATAWANPSQDTIDLYNQAAQGDSALVEQVRIKLEQRVEAEGKQPLTLVYLGGTHTLMGRDAWMPWNKLSHVETGVSFIHQGLALLKEQAVPLDEQPRVLGLPDSQLAQANAAVTFTQLPEFFGQFDAGYDLYLTLLSDKAFEAQPIEACAWVYLYAIHAALKADDDYQARLWLKTLEGRAPQHPITDQARALLEDG
ncbi:hypothetical protein [Ferrimonas sp. YFM]|uniref:hypothetical protein n=1 Tax=Ferrimonas sp. YFM TaxID=3028878 RepID=UPI0025733FC5|nr:hypothetical protein [Ferrimonas sp. YFM]BDY04325.1 hypothetical protein F0521_13660 [Ferrimonas sp. YFM]